ncbi:DUF4416 family protein [Fibrobacter intestinalis]|uniref:DUF4416 family protein n=1 Tax=Fibrobacter intestinalis TaxID=28122 RepID=UPI0023EFC3CB|nr:DUF4416 family protein [Fibrobacter intestinalis]MDD7298415.1 DUF4416 family protein [Fibrobacter intestinalis]
MGLTHKPQPSKLVMGFLAKDAELIARIRPRLRHIYGEEDLVLEPFPFRFTNYYKEEIGENPVRAFVCYQKLIERETIVDIKLQTNEMELDFAKECGSDGLRPVNLDPGYMTLGQFFLATTKDQRQRVYMRDGIYVEPTLYFQDGHFHPFKWTYRDYQSEEYIRYLENVRKELRKVL